MRVLVLVLSPLLVNLVGQGFGDERPACGTCAFDLVITTAGFTDPAFAFGYEALVTLMEVWYRQVLL